MSVLADTKPFPGDGEESNASGGAGKLLFDISAIDLSARLIDKSGIESRIPHRGTMSLLDAIVWHGPDFAQTLGYKFIRGDDFWVQGHFPGKPTFPGVLMIETAAQLACWTFLARRSDCPLVLFLRIEHASFRHAVVPGDHFFILCQEFKTQRRRFVSDVMGVVGDKIAFDARISGIMTDARGY
jgi:3-hydroxyacyl-[acyl-carrier-protein] dehydratase